MLRVFSIWIVLLTLGTSASSQSNPPPNYYDNGIGTTGEALKAALHKIIKGHTVLPYTSTATDTWDALKILDESPGDPSSVVLVYSGLTNLKASQYAGGVGAGKWDREHLFPQSYGLVAISASSRAKTDVFNLRPIDYTVNSTRGNLYYDITTTPFRTTAGAPGSSYDSDSWEPRNGDKGQIARSLFYMAVRYDGTDADTPDLELSDTPNAAQFEFGKLTTLLAWHRQFPVMPAERQRNQRIYSDFQHNRNPFIDHAEYAEMVFNGVSHVEAWRRIHFTTAELANPAIGSNYADADGDGTPNLLEYEFNSDPRNPTPGQLVATGRVHSGVDYLYVTFPRNRNAGDVQVFFEGSTDLRSWSAASSEIVGTTITNFETEQLTVRIPAPSPVFFVRLRATLPP